MGKPDQVSSIFWLILGLALVYDSNQLGLGAFAHPGPGFFPFWCGAILIGLSILVFFQGRQSQRDRRGSRLSQLWDGLVWTKPIYIIISLLVYALTFPSLGFLLSTTLLLIFLFKAIEPATWMLSIIGAVLASSVSYILFGVWLRVQLPRGFLEGLFF